MSQGGVALHASVSESDLTLKLKKDEAYSQTSGRLLLQKAASRDFQPRNSLLDRDTIRKDHPRFMGVLVLFWMVMAHYAFATIIKNLTASRWAIGTQLLSLITRDGWVLGLSDMVFTLLTVMAFFFQRGVVTGK